MRRSVQRKLCPPINAGARKAAGQPNKHGNDDIVARGNIHWRLWSWGEEETIEDTPLI